MGRRITVLTISLLLVAGAATGGDRRTELKSELRFLESLEPAGQALCTDPELEEMHGSCRVWIDQDGRYHYFLMLRRKEPWKVWRVSTEGAQKPEVRWRASEGCSDDAVCA